MQVSDGAREYVVMGSNTVKPRRSEVAAETRKLRRDDLGLSTPFEAPKIKFEHELTSIWQQVLGVDQIGTSDDFFELGGDSFAATTLAAEIEARFGLRFAPSDIINLSTIAKQAQAIASKADAALPKLPSTLIAGRTTGSKQPLFMVHGGSGFAFIEPGFVEVIGEDRPVYFFQARGLDGRVPPLNRVEDIARLYVQSMREVQPSGPYNITAMCAGAFIALEMCNQIEEAGETIGHLILLDPDTMPPAWKEQRARPGSKVHLKTALDRIPPERRTHVTESILKVVQELHEAARNYVPRPYSGTARVLVNAKKARKIVDKSAFWQCHLGGMEYEVFNVNHEELFRAKLIETAWFVRDTLDN
jgi:thioesterase domain-containing protein/acyl carrier protein